MKRPVLAFATLALVLATGCDKIKEKIAEKAAEKAVETATGGDVKISSGGVTVKDDKTGASAQLGTGAKVPDDWPSNVPVYPGTVQASMAGENGKTVIVQTKDTPAKVSDFYKAKLTGMKKQAEMDLGASKTLAWVDGKTTVSLMVSAGGDDDHLTTVQLSVATQK
jgi:hypothetical protein